MSYPNLIFSKLIGIFIVKVLIIECSYAIEYCPKDLELKPRGTSSNIKPPDNCKLLTCSPDPTMNSKIKNLDFHEFLDQLEKAVIVFIFHFLFSLKDNPIG